MKFSEKWLREFVNPSIDTQALSEQLTMAGLEVDDVSPACSEFDGLVVAEVKALKKHPEADKLYICEVDCGEDELLTIVCGASNVKKGMRTVLAKEGARLPGIPELKPVSLKGVSSHGMLCSASEIGLGEDSAGIIELSSNELIGTSFRELIESDDNIIEISLTPNRGDCLSVQGIAREVAVLNHMDFNKKIIDPVTPTINASRNINLIADNACPRYVGRIIENVDASVSSPLWLTEKLRRSGIRSISIVVDITNYVMLELGQPMHAFDNDKLKGEISVRYSKDSESIKLLDELNYEIRQETLLIADESGPLAMAGIMGGFDSAVGLDSRNIFLESAFFTPDSIIGEARQYGLHTDSSHRFERGVDPQLQIDAIERASGLILDLCGGYAGSVIEVKSEQYLPKNEQVILRQSQIKRVLGVDLDEQFVTDTFRNLGMKGDYVEKQWFIEPSSHRFDIKIEVDLIEELARIYSYNAISVATPTARLKMQAVNPTFSLVKQISGILIDRDYQEVITYSFVDPKSHKLLKNKSKTMVLANPIAPELSEMRTSLWPGLLNTLQYNLKRQQERVRLFESGLVFNGCDDLKQDYHIAGLIYGKKYKKQWNNDNISSDLFDIKSDVEMMLATFVSTDRLQYKASSAEMLHPGQAVDVLINDNTVAIFGQLHPQITSELDIPDETYLFEIDIKNINFKREIQYAPISRFPSIKRDIAIIIDELIPVADVMQLIRDKATNLLNNLQLFDLYQGEGIEKGKKSLALGLTFQATSSTLKDEEVETIMGNIIDGLHNNFGAKLRE